MATDPRTPDLKIIAYRVEELEGDVEKHEERLSEHDKMLGSINTSLATISTELRTGVRVIGPVVTGIVVGLVITVATVLANQFVGLLTHHP